MSDARRKVQQGGVRINGEKVNATTAPPADAYFLQAGKLDVVRVTRRHGNDQVA